MWLEETFQTLLYLQVHFSYVLFTCKVNWKIGHWFLVIGAALSCCGGLLSFPREISLGYSPSSSRWGDGWIWTLGSPGRLLFGSLSTCKVYYMINQLYFKGLSFSILFFISFFIATKFVFGYRSIHCFCSSV